MRKRVSQLLEFYEQGEKNEPVVFTTPTGDYYSPEAVKRMRQHINERIGFLRQWLNEDRITSRKMVTDEEIKLMLNL